MPISLTGELGFLFDMMLAINDSAQVHPQVVSKVVISSNFQRALRVTPEAITSGLFPPAGVIESTLISSPLTSPLSMVPLSSPTIDEVMTLSRGVSDGSTASYPSPPTVRGLGSTEPSSASSLVEAKALQKKIQIFTKFIFQQLKTEFDADAAHHLASHLPFTFHDAISSTFAFQSITTTTFLTSQTKGLTTHHTASCSELALPSPPPMTSPPLPHHHHHYHRGGSEMTPFAEVLYATVNKTSHMRGWCAATDSYEPCRQTKRIQLSTLQNILTLPCGDTISTRNQQRKTPEGKQSAVHHNSWRSRNSLGGPWLPSVVEVIIPATFPLSV
jgi:hypothetical protein